MGMYACNECFERHELVVGYGIAHTGWCEVCQVDRRWLNFTCSVSRFHGPVGVQLWFEKAWRVSSRLAPRPKLLLEVH